MEHHGVFALHQSIHVTDIRPLHSPRTNLSPRTNHSPRTIHHSPRTIYSPRSRNVLSPRATQYPLLVLSPRPPLSPGLGSTTQNPMSPTTRQTTRALQVRPRGTLLPPLIAIHNDDRIKLKKCIYLYMINTYSSIEQSS